MLLCATKIVPKLSISAGTIVRQNYRLLSAFQSNNAYEIWKCTSSVSNAGARKGRGRRGVVRRKDLNIGQCIGEGRLRMQIPGLTSTPNPSSIPEQIKELGHDQDFDKRLLNARSKMDAFRRIAILSSERGWTGGHMGGRSFGKVTDVENNQFGYELESLETKILYLSQKQIMTKVFGRKKRVRALVACGNGAGVIGIGAAVGSYVSNVLNKAKQKSARNLVHIVMNEERSVLHDFIGTFGFVEMYVSRREQGFGLVCHRLIKTLCQLIGIENLYAKQIGTTNPVSMTNAFIIGLLQQKSYKTIANEQGLHVVKIDPLRNGFPQILASPDTLISDAKSRDKDFDRICLGGKVPMTHLPHHHATIMSYTYNSESYFSKYLKSKVHMNRYHRKKLVDTLAIDEIEDSKWRYPIRVADALDEGAANVN